MENYLAEGNFESRSRYMIHVVQASYKPILLTEIKTWPTIYIYNNCRI